MTAIAKTVWGQKPAPFHRSKLAALIVVTIAAALLWAILISAVRSLLT